MNPKEILEKIKHVETLTELLYKGVIEGIHFLIQLKDRDEETQRYAIMRVLGYVDKTTTDKNNLWLIVWLVDEYGKQSLRIFKINEFLEDFEVIGTVRWFNDVIEIFSEEKEEDRS